MTTWQRSTTRNAFTLVEVLVAVAIMGLAAAIVVPQMLKPGTLHVQAAARAVMADLMVAQNDAIVRQADRRFEFLTNDQGRFVGYRVTDADGQPIPAPWNASGQFVVHLQGDHRFGRVHFENVNFASDDDADAFVAFDDLGSPGSTGGTLDVVSGDTRYRIRMATFTGKLTVASVTSGG